MNNYRYDWYKNEENNPSTKHNLAINHQLIIGIIDIKTKKITLNITNNLAINDDQL